MSDLEIVYHVFSDERDAWVPDFKAAKALYQEFVKSGNARLFEEIYRDRENDDMVSEECLLAYGPYPL